MTGCDRPDFSKPIIMLKVHYQCSVAKNVVDLAAVNNFKEIINNDIIT